MGLWKRGKVWQYDVIVSGQRAFGSCKTTDKHDAQVILGEVVERLRENIIKPNSKAHAYTLTEAIERAYNNHWRLTKSGEQTRKRMLMVAELVGKGIDLQQFDHNLIEEVRRTLSK
jgi:hypothetical protein